jgi:hypothetical protein
MAKKTETELAPTTDAAITIPDWMKEEKIEGVDNVGEFQTTPRLSIVQAMSQAERKDLVGEGGVVIMPDGVPVAKKDEEFTVAPLVFWPTWEAHSDINDAASPFIVEQTTDPTSALAIKSRTKETREEVYGDGFKMKYVECLNFVVRIESGAAIGELATMTFSSGEHYTGAKLCGMLKRRPCSIFANRIALKVVLRTRNNRSWYGFDITNPADGAIVEDKAVYDELAEIHQGLARMVNTSKLIVSQEDKAALTETFNENLPL